MSTQANGSGGVRLHKSGRYEARATDPITGKRVSVYADSEGAAERALRKMLARADSGEVVLDVSATLRAYCKAWLADRAGRRRSQATVREYKRRLESYVLPKIGGIKVKALTVVDVEDVLDDLAAEGLGEASLKGARNALAAMLSDAVRARKLKANVATLARLPEDMPARKIRIVPTPDQVVALIDSTKGTDLGAIVVLLAGTGARIGEALAATWSSIDLDEGTWSISRTVTRDAKGSAVLGARTKTGDSRIVALPVDVVDALKEQRKRVAAARLALGEAWSDLDLVFPTSIGTVTDPHNVRRRLKEAAPTFPGSFHGLRHAFASAAVAVLPSDAAVAKVLGHARKATTVDLYGHLRAEDSRSVANAVAAQLAAARSSKAAKSK
jgi:integrase